MCPEGLSYCEWEYYCINLSTDPNNCGSCGNKASAVVWVDIPPSGWMQLTTVSCWRSLC
jgi:hypothetical protein